LGDGKRERAAARLDLMGLASAKDYKVKSQEVINWLKRKSLQDMGITVSEKELFVDELNDLMDINSMWSSMRNKRGK
jgi:hypothetical protein